MIIDDDTLKLFKSASLGIKVALAALLVLAVTIVLSTGWVIYELISLKVMAENQVLPSKSQFAKTETGRFRYRYSIDNIAVEVPSSRRLQGAHAQFTLVFDCQTERVKRALLLNRARVRDSVFEVASEFTIEKFKTAEGFSAFKSAILGHVRGYLKDDSPQNVSIESWLMN